MKPDNNESNEPKYGYYRNAFASENERRYFAELRKKRWAQQYKDFKIACALIFSLIVLIIVLIKFDT